MFNTVCSKIHQLTNDFVILTYLMLWIMKGNKSGKRKKAGSSASRKKPNTNMETAAAATTHKPKTDNEKLTPLRKKNSVGHANPNIYHQAEHHAKHHQAHHVEHNTEHHQVHHVEHKADHHPIRS